MSRAQLESLGGGRFRVGGPLDAASVVGILADSQQRFAESKTLEVDLSGVTEADSAGLALLLEWLRLAQIDDRTIRFHGLPAQISALARISEVEDLFGDAIAAVADDKKLAAEA